MVTVIHLVEEEEFFITNEDTEFWIPHSLTDNYFEFSLMFNSKRVIIIIMIAASKSSVSIK